MKKLIKGTALAVCALGVSMSAMAGNKDRIGQAGATELSINPWAKSTGVFGMNTAYVGGLDAMKTNVAGLALVEKMEVGVAHTRYLSGTGVNVSNLAFATRLGSSTVAGVNIMSMGFGEIPIATFDNPEGSIGTFSPQFLNVNLGFSKQFSNSIHAGVGATFVSEQIADAHASGAAFEAGIQYITGMRDNFHFGITLRNIGTNMRYSGSGFMIDTDAPGNEQVYALNRATPSERFEMPTYLNFGAAYDFYLDENHLQDADSLPKHRLTVMASFTSNSFNNDFLGLGLEYSFRERFQVRGGYRYENGIGTDESTTFYTGLAAGASVMQRLGKSGPILALDYSYRPTQRPTNGVHTFSLRLMR